MLITGNPTLSPQSHFDEYLLGEHLGGRGDDGVEVSLAELAEVVGSEAEDVAAGGQDQSVATSRGGADHASATWVRMGIETRKSVEAK